MSIEVVLSILGLLGIGGIIGGYFQYLWNHKRDSELKIQELNENKYRSVLVFMRCVLKPENADQFDINDPYFPKKSPNDVIRNYAKRKLTEFYYDSILYASDNVIKAENAFLADPTELTFFKVAVAMRKDLWNKSTSIDFVNLTKNESMNNVLKKAGS